MKKHLTILFVLFSNFSFSQKCDCNIYPITKECKKECGIKLLQNGSASQLKSELQLDEQTIQKVVSLPNRKQVKSIDDFQDNLPYKSYIKLEREYSNWINRGSVIQISNGSGDNINGDKNIYNK